MKPLSASNFKQNDERHLKHLRLKGLQPKTISAYSRAIQRIGAEEKGVRYRLKNQAKC